MKYNVITLLKNLKANIKYILKYKLEDREKTILYNALDRVEDIYRFEILDDENIYSTMQVPNVLNYDQTIELLLNEPKSFCRFGDGEINIINGKSIPFQQYDKHLAEKLLKILRCNDENIYVGINYNYFHNTRNFTAYNRAFYLIDVKEYRDFLLNNCNKNRKYIAAGFNQLYMVLKDYDFKAYYAKIKKLFSGRDVIIFTGEGIDNIQYDVFEFANSKEIIYAPSKNAYSEYDAILLKAQSYPKDKLLCFILGPASKVLVYELAQKGYLAYDIGHMAKDYDSYMKKTEKTKENIIDFFAPD